MPRNVSAAFLRYFSSLFGLQRDEEPNEGAPGVPIQLLQSLLIASVHLFFGLPLLR